MYVHAVSKLVETRIAEGRMKELVGGTAAKRFRTAVEEFNELYISRRTRNRLSFGIWDYVHSRYLWWLRYSR